MSLLLSTHDAALLIHIPDQLEIKGTAPSADVTSFGDWTRKVWLGDAGQRAFEARLATVTAHDITVVTDTDTGSAALAKPKSGPSKSNSLHVAVPSKNILPPPPPLRLDVVRPAVRATVSSGLKSTTAFADSAFPLFELLVHPDYRSAPPRPAANPQGGAGAKQYSPSDYLPTDTLYLYDLIFAIRRRSLSDTKQNLQSITIEIPVADPATDRLPSGLVREPLIEAGDYQGSGVRMCSNQRFVAAVFKGTTSSVGSPVWDAKPGLIITLIPRSAADTGSLPLLADARAAQASVRLAEPRIAETVDTSSMVYIAGLDAHGRPTGVPTQMGKAMIRMIEHYENGVIQWSWCAAIKRKGDDKDNMQSSS